MKHLGFWVLGLLVSATGCLGAEVSDGGEETASTDQPIIDGNTDFTGRTFQQQRTVRVRASGGGICSGTLVLPNVVLTARHCVAADHKENGPLATPSDIRVRIMDAPFPPAKPPAVDQCAGAGRDHTCAVGARLADISPDVDMAFIGLADPVSFDTDFTMFTPLELSQDLSDYLGDRLMISGWGQATCDGPGGVLRWTNETVVDVDVGRFERAIRLAPLLQQGSAQGDSGGPTWGNRTFPVASLAVDSRGPCTIETDGSSTAGRSTEIAVANHLPDVRRMVATAAGRADFIDQLDVWGHLEFIDVDTTDAAPNWQIPSGHLKQTGNAGPTIVLVRDEIVQRVVGGAYSVKVSSTDNDVAGIVFSYFDRNNYMTCETNAQTHALEATLVRAGKRTVLATTPWKGDYAPAVVISADLTPTSNLAFPIRCSVSGSDKTSVTASSDLMPAGRVGIYNAWLDEATYSSFVANELDGSPIAAPPSPPTPTPPPHQCNPLDEQCCERDPDGGCSLCVGKGLTCQ